MTLETEYPGQEKQVLEGKRSTCFLLGQLSWEEVRLQLLPLRGLPA